MLHWWHRITHRDPETAKQTVTSEEVRAALTEAQEASTIEHVIEWAGQPVRSVKQMLKGSGPLSRQIPVLKSPST